MMTWFSVRRATLVTALAFTLGGRGAARAQGAASGASEKVRAKQMLAEARLAAARAAAGEKKADARELYGEALGWALAAAGQAAADGAAPRPTSATSVANEEVGAAPPAEAPTPSPAPEAEEAARARAEAAAAEEAKVAAQAAARARAEAESARARAEEASRRAPAPVATSAPVLVAAAPPPPAAAPPMAFALGERTAIAARDPSGGHHASVGLVFSWLTFATSYGRGTAVVDLESTRLRAGRDDTSDREQVAFYGLGFDWTVPWALRGTGLSVDLGAEAAAGVLQGSTRMTTAVATDAALQLMPHVGGAVAVGPVALFADAGWRWQARLGSDTGDASVGGFVAQGGLRVTMSPGEAPAPRALEVGYAARVYAPNGSGVYKTYGGLPLTSGAGPLLEHELFVTTKAGLPRHADVGLAATYLGAEQAGGGAGLHVAGLGAVGTWHAFATRELINPFLGLRLGLAYISNGDTATFQYAKQVGLVGEGAAGFDVGLGRRAALRLAVAYDGVEYSNKNANASLSGYVAEAGVIFRP